MCKGCGGPTSGPSSSRRCRKLSCYDMTLASGRAAGRAVALQKGGSMGSLGRWVAERGRERPRPGNPQRHGRAAWLFRAGRGQPQRGASAGRRGGVRPTDGPSASPERRLNGPRSHHKRPLTFFAKGGQLATQWPGGSISARAWSSAGVLCWGETRMPRSPSTQANPPPSHDDAKATR